MRWCWIEHRHALHDPAETRLVRVGVERVARRLCYGVIAAALQHANLREACLERVADPAALARFVRERAQRHHGPVRVAADPGKFRQRDVEREGFLPLVDGGAQLACARMRRVARGGVAERCIAQREQRLRGSFAGLFLLRDPGRE